MDEYSYSSEDATWGHQYLWPVLEDALQEWAPPPRRVFELGCGNGVTARMLAEAGYDVVAVDPSQTGVTIAQRFNSSRLRVEVASTEQDLAGRFGRFPVVVSLEVIEHVPSTAQYCRALAGLLEPSGIAIVSTPFHGYLKNLLIAATGRFDRHHDPLWEGGHVKFFSEATLRGAFANSGLEVLRFVRAGRLPIVAKSVVAVVRKP